VEDYKKALAFTLRYEGGYANHPNDKGGETNRGITHTTYDTYRKVKGLPVQSVKLITDEEVNDIYYKMYWLTASCDKLPYPLNMVVFDAAVNHGPLKAIKLLQRILGLHQDGLVGPKTLAAVATIKDDYGACDDYMDEREAFFNAIVAANSSQSVFLKGWLNRVASLRKLTS